MNSNDHSYLNPKSQSGIYVIYDLIGGCTPKNHICIPVKGFTQAVEQYKFYKAFNPHLILGLCTIEYYRNLMKSYGWSCDV